MKFVKILLGLTLILTTATTFARDTKHMYSIQEALESADFKSRLYPDIALYFGEQPHPKVVKSLGSYPTNKKTNAFNKSDIEACQWVLLSALLTLQERAQKEGGNAVVNINSYYKKNTFSSETEYECHAGAFVAGVALMGEVVTLAD
ncbi:hypothetical protein [Aliiglaciecola lipolytica]|uniref:Excinuclease ATPase subunit n=1 Tax=Aliiglaciecola lipolytica E3 TaxID=1127673 RepID=K6Y8Y8_9ALTE|nr:hypothetical protein [Aliiglaciecola lipolytica]GAC13123.1 hypothetical protein GLIP_0477 [Aliiglaciecola lipolytica E3]